MKNYKNMRGIWQKEAQCITKLARQKGVKKISEAMWHIMRKYP
jgi:glycogen synthase